MPRRRGNSDAGGHGRGQRRSRRASQPSRCARRSCCRTAWPGRCWPAGSGSRSRLRDLLVDGAAVRGGRQEAGTGDGRVRRLGDARRPPLRPGAPGGRSWTMTEDLQPLGWLRGRVPTVAITAGLLDPGGRRPPTRPSSQPRGRGMRGADPVPRPSWPAPRAPGDTTPARPLMRPSGNWPCPRRWNCRPAASSPSSVPAGPMASPTRPRSSCARRADADRGRPGDGVRTGRSRHPRGERGLAFGTRRRGWPRRSPRPAGPSGGEEAIAGRAGRGQTPAVGLPGPRRSTWTGCEPYLFRYPRAKSSSPASTRARHHP